MSPRGHSLRDERGQALGFFAIFLAVLVGMSALVIDVGSWFREQRHLQTAADAAALAGAPELPEDWTTADAKAREYGDLNRESSASFVVTPTQRTTVVNGDTIHVRVTSRAPGFFSRLYGILEVDVGARATARVGSPASLKNIVPIAVKNTQEKLACSPSPCFNERTRINFNESELSSSSFGIIDLSCPGAGCSGGAGTRELEDWINLGFNGYVAVDSNYPAVTGERIGPIRNTLEANIGRTLLFPVFDTASNETKTFHIIGWAAFVIDEVIEWRKDNPPCRPLCKVLDGHFVEYIAQGFLSAPGGGAPPYFGVKVVGLIE